VKRLSPAAVVSALLLVQVSVGGACSQQPKAPHPDDGPDGGRPGPGHGCRGNTTCDPFATNTVRSCAADGTTAPLYTCDPGLACSLGRCVSPSCVNAETLASVTGCLFYTAEMDNVDSDDSQSSLIVVTNPGSTPATLSLQARTPGQDWTEAQAMAIAGGSAGSFIIGDQHLEGAGVGYALARRVVSDTPVTVMLIESADLDEAATSSAGTMVLPIHALGTRYMAMTYQQQSTPEIDVLAGGRGGAAEITIVATQDNTTFQIWRAGRPLSSDPEVISLQNDGDLYQILSEDNFDDLSGTTILGNKPFAVFSGNVTTTYGKTTAGINSPDTAMEQMLPIGAWSKSYVATRLPAQSAACDSTLGGTSVGLWRFLAAEQTQLRFHFATPIDPPPDPMEVSPGTVYEMFIDSEHDFVVEADAPFLMTQGMDCEPTLSSAVPADASGGVVQLFALPPNYDHEAAIVRRNDGNGLAGRVTLDDQDITADFVAAGQGFEVARHGFPPCSGSAADCVHRLTGAYGLTLRGMDVVCGYAVTFPTWVNCIDAGCE
jgi:hypothetical protein